MLTCSHLSLPLILQNAATYRHDTKLAGLEVVVYSDRETHFRPELCDCSIINRSPGLFSNLEPNIGKKSVYLVYLCWHTK